MIHEKTRRSKAFRNKGIRVRAKSVKFPIVLLQRLRFGKNDTILSKESTTDKLNISEKTHNGEIFKTTELKNFELNDSSNIVLNNLENEKTASQCPNTVQTMPILHTDITTQKTEISNVPAISMKVSGKIKAEYSTKYTVHNNLEEDNLKINLLQEQSSHKVSATGQVFKNSELVNNISKKTMEAKTTISTRSRLLSKSEVNDCTKSSIENVLENTYASSIPQTINMSSTHERDFCHSNASSREENIVGSIHTTKSKLHEIIKTNKLNHATDNSSLVKISGKSMSTKTIDNEIIDPIEHNNEKKSIGTRTTVCKKTEIRTNRRSVLKSTPKQTNNKSSLNKKILNHDLKEINSADSQYNNNTEESNLTKDKLSDIKVTDECNKVFLEEDRKSNLCEVQTNSKSKSYEKTLNNLKLTTDTTTVKNSALRNIIPTRSRVQIDGYSSAPKKISVKSKVDTDSLKIKEKIIEIHKYSNKSKLIKKKPDNTDHETVKDEMIQQKETHSTLCLSKVQINNESSIIENALDQQISEIDFNKGDETMAEKKSILSTSNALDNKNRADPERIIIENNCLQSERTHFPLFSAIGEKPILSRKSNGTSKFSAKCLKTNDNVTKNIISTSSRLLNKIKIDINKKLTIEKPNIEITTVQLKQNQSILTFSEVPIRDESPSSEKLLVNPKNCKSNRTLEELDTSNVSRQSKQDENKMDIPKKSDKNDTICVKPNDSTSESQPMEIIEQLVTNNKMQDSLELTTDLSNTKKNISNRSKLCESTKEADNEKSNMENENQLVSNQTEVQIINKSSLIGLLINSQTCLTDSIKTIGNVGIETTNSTRMIEENKRDTHESINLDDNTPHIEINNSTLNPFEVVISNISLENEKVLGSSKRIIDSVISPKKIGVRKTIATRSRLHKLLRKKNEVKSYERPICESNAISVKESNSTLKPSQVQDNDESTLNTSDSQILPHAPAVNTDDFNKTISTRNRITKKSRTNLKVRGKKKKAMIRNQLSASEFRAHDASIAKQFSDINLENKTNNCNISVRRKICCEKEIIIKLFRCDQVQPINNCATKTKTVEKKSPQHKRKREHESTFEDVPKIKNSILINSSDNSVNLSVPSENQELIIDNEISLSTVKDFDKLVVKSQCNVESNTNNILTIIENICENGETTYKDVRLKHLSDNNTLETMDCVSKTPGISEKKNQCDKDNECMENDKEFIVNSSDDNVSAHAEELREDTDEEIFLVDTSDSEINGQNLINNDDVMTENRTSTNLVHNKENHSLLSRKMVEEIINDWAVADDDKTDNIDNNDENEYFITPEPIQIDNNEHLNEKVNIHQEAVNTEKDQNERILPSHNLITTARKSSTDIFHSSQIETETDINVNKLDSMIIENKKCSNIEQETRALNSTSELTSEMSEAEDVDDSNFESIDENSCTDVFINGNCNKNENNESQETITYYNSEDISMDVLDDPNRLNDVVMNLKDACDKITADLSGADASYENSEESSNQHTPELLLISDDSNEAEGVEEVIIIEPQSQIHLPQLRSVNQKSLLISNQLRQVIQHGTPSISVIKASELRDEILEPPVEYPIKPSDQQVIVHPQRQMLSTTLLPANVINDKGHTPSLFTEESIMKCPKCKCEFVGKSRLRRHWLTCGDAMYLYCPFCTTKVKQRRSLLHHFNTQHIDQINKQETVKLVDQIVKQTREAADVKLKQDCSLSLQDLIRNNTSITPIIELPAFIRIQCVVCNKIYDEVPATYKKNCDECSSDLMTAICQLCRKQYMLSSKIAVHVQGNCIFSGRIKCRDCEFVASSRYILQEHIIRKHIYIPPEDYVTCTLGCGKTFRIHDALRKHERICGKEANLKCRFCDYKTKHRSAMKMHVQQHIVHKKIAIKSDGTVKLFAGQRLAQNKIEKDVRDLKTEQQVRSVIRVHCSRCNRTLRLTSNRSSCEYCKLSFTFSCSRCSDSIHFDSLHAARLHVIRTHCVKIHECPHCVEKFSYVYDLTKHVSKCKPKTLSCECCNYVTNQRCKLNSHIRRVHIFNSPTCKKCGKWFKRGDSLKRHETSHCGVKPGLSCEHCRFKTKTKFSLLRHIQSQHAYIYENFNFVCDRCNKFYTNMFAYEAHVKDCHALYNN